VSISFFGFIAVKIAVRVSAVQLCFAQSRWAYFIIACPKIPDDHRKFLPIQSDCAQN
jgi:hypothetical protein